MFENILIFLALTVLGASLITITSQPTWHGQCPATACEVSLGLG